MQNEPVQMDMNKYLQIIKRRKYWFIIPLFLITLIGSLYAAFLPPVFRSSATILIEAQEIPPEYVRSSVTSYAAHRIQTINQRIMSRVKLMEIINQLDLYKEMRRKKNIEDVIDKMRNDIKLDMVSAGVTDRSGHSGATTIAFRVSYQSEIPDIAQRVCNILSSLYLEENIKTRERHARETSEFLKDEADTLKEEIGELQKKIAQFKKEHMGQLPELMDMNLQTLMRLDKEITDVENQIGILEDRKAYFDGQLVLLDPYTSSGQEKADNVSPDVERLKNLKIAYTTALANLSPDHPDIKMLQRQIQVLEKEVGKSVDLSEEENRLAKLRAELASLQEKYTLEHPEVVSLKNKIASLEKEIQARPPEEDSSPKKSLRPTNPAYINLQTYIISAELEIEALKRERDELKKQRDMYQKRIEMTPQVEKEYSDLKIHLVNATKKYNDILSKLMEAKVSMGLEKEQKGERFTMIDPPVLPTKPFKPNRIAILLVSVILGMGSGIGFGAVAEIMDNTIRSEYDLMGTLFQPLLTVIPIIESEKEIRKRKWKWIFIILFIILLIALSLFLVHLYVIDLEILWLKIYRTSLKQIKRVF